MNKILEYILKVGADVKGAKQVEEAFEDVQARAKRGLDEIKVKADPKELEEVEKLIEEIGEIAKRPKPLAIDNKDAIRDLRDVEKRLDAVVKKSREKPRGFMDKLKGDLRDLRTEVPAVGKVFDGLALIAKGPIAILVGAIAGLTLGWKAAGASFRAYLAESEKLAAFDARLAQQGALTDANRKKFLDLANQLQATTAIADDQWLETIGKLVQYGSDPASIGMDIDTVKNLAALLKGDLTQATRLYTLALQGNFGSLSELGIVIDQTGTKAERLAQLQRFAAEKGAGILEAQAAGAAGSVKQLGNEIGDTAEAFGRLIARTGIVQAGIEGFRNTLGAVRRLLPEATERLDGLTNRLPALATALEEATAASEELKQKALDEVGESAGEAEGRVRSLIQSLRELEQQQLILAEKKLGNELAGIDLEEARGNITPEQANEQRFDARQKAEEVKNKATATRLEAEIAALAESLLEQTQEVRAAEERIAALENERGETDETLQPLKSQDEALTSKEDQLRKQIAALKFDLEAAEGAVSSAGSDPMERNDALFEMRSVQRRLAEAEKSLSATETARADLQESPEFTEANAARDALTQELEVAQLLLEKRKEIEQQAAQSAAEGIRRASAERALLEQVSTIEKDTEQKKRQIEIIGDSKAAKEREALEASQALASRFEDFGGDFEVRRNQGKDPETDQEFRTRQMKVRELTELAKSQAALLADGTNNRELEDLASAMLGLAQQVQRSLGNDREKELIQQMLRDIRLLQTQTANLR